MPHLGIIHYDIAAVVIMAITLLSLIFRRITSGPTSRVYISAIVLVLVTALIMLIGELYDLYMITCFPQSELSTMSEPSPLRDTLTVAYLALRSLTAPAYLVLIASVSGTTHKLNDSHLIRILLWVPMISVVLITVTNPLHHLVYSYVAGNLERGPLMPLLYATAGYYSLAGIAWLIRWRAVLGEEELATLFLLYPIILCSVAIQYFYPDLHIEMFLISVAIMLVSAFVIRPERRLDSLVHAGSLQGYREMCHRIFITKKPLCLVYLEIVNLEKLRDLVGKDELQNIVNHVANTLFATLERNDQMYYLRNGLFCIVPNSNNAERALAKAWETHNRAKARSDAHREKMSITEMRTCIVRIPEDVDDLDTLAAFVRRFGNLVPRSDVVTYSELSKRDGFALEMAIPDVVTRAIEQRSFEVHYQPIWCVREKCFHSAEALVRLRDDEFGWISPSLFIPAAEQNGSILVIGRILLEKVFKLLGEFDFDATGLSYVEVNLSVEQCIQPNMVADVLSLADRYHIDPARLNLEITETSPAFSRGSASDNIRRLADAGYAFALDDYGTGYSNTIRALSLPFSLVKFDKSFVDGLDNPSVRTVLASAIASMKEIGKNVLIEGVETAEQADMVIAMGVDYIQGYYYAKPLPEREFTAFLIEHNK